MTGMLKDLMHDRADGLDAATLDLTAITREAERRVRRRRIAAGAGGTAALLALAGIVPQLADRDRRAADNDVATSEAALLTWAEGSVIHSGGRTIDVGREVHAFVQTDDGFVFTDAERTVWTWEDGRADDVGTVLRSADSGAPELVTDGVHTMWVDGHDPDQPSFTWIARGGEGGGFAASAPVAGDQKGGSRQSPAQPPAVLALADGVGYVSAAGLTSATALDDDAGEPPMFDGDVMIEDVANGTYLLTTTSGGEPGADEVTVVTRDPAQPGRALDVRGGDLSPAATYVMSENSARSSDTFTLLDVDSGEDLTPAVAREYDFFLGYAWADDDTYTAFGMHGIGQGTAEDDGVVIDLLTCSVDARACVVADAHPDLQEFQLPVGEHIGD